MKNWQEEFQLVNLTKLLHSDTETSAAISNGQMIKLTHEVAINAEKYRSLPAWDKAAARAFAVGYKSDLEQIDGNSSQTSPTPIPDDVELFKVDLPALDNKDGEVTQYWSIPVEDYERVQVTTSYVAPVTFGLGNDYLSIRNELLYIHDTC